MKQVVLLTLSLAVLLSTLASAENDAIKLGDYNVSFDLGLPKSAYNVYIKDPPQQTETLSGDLLTVYYTLLSNKTDTKDLLIMGLIKSEDKPQAAPNASELQVMLNSILGQVQGTKSNIEIATRKVDGTEGAVTSYDYDFGHGVVKKNYLLGYAPNFDNPPLVWAYSTFPWDNTLRFLKTIHIGEQKL